MAKIFHSNGTLTTIQAAIAACAVLAGSVSWSGTATAEEVSSRLSRVERDIETLSQAVYKGKMPPASATSSGSNEYQSNVEVRLSDIEGQIRDMTGKVEQQNFEINQLKDRLDRALADMEMRLSSAGTSSSNTQTGTLAPNDMGGPVDNSGVGMTTLEPATITQTPSTAGDVVDMNAPVDPVTQNNLGTLTESPGGASISPQPGNDPTGQYEMAFSLLKSGKYAASRNGFDEFLKKYPSHPLAPNALYWLGENYYAEGTFDKATRVFAESYKKYPKGPKAPDSLLKLGMALEKSGKTPQACITLQQIKKEFPSGSASILRMADQERAKMGCGD
ncbi:MAG: tol-pal system protein YbgF [Alphaproteobacteria bacterium CG1_02_46_17]|nr:MAG: tol-pal system protein YbgF [Alphaproteobacteria bacterium CG1_02_46_17]